MTFSARHVFIYSLLINLLLAAALALSLHGYEQQKVDARYMLEQCIAVFEVEQFITAHQPWRNAAEIRGYAEMIVDAATEFQKDPIVVARVALAESSINPMAVGDGGKAIGIMQVHTRWWVGTVPFVRSASDLRDARTNIRAGAWILRHYAGLCGAEPEAYLACYNGGERPNERARAYGRRVAGGA